jgi:hypothetical protein
MNAFDHRPDPALGEALRAALSSSDDAAFVRRVMERVPQTIRRDPWWEVLSEWARPGVAAAVAALVVFTVWTTSQDAADPAVSDEPVAVAETLSAGTLLASEVLPEFQVEMVLGEERINE